MLTGYEVLAIGIGFGLVLAACIALFLAARRKVAEGTEAFNEADAAYLDAADKVALGEALVRTAQAIREQAAAMQAAQATDRPTLSQVLEDLTEPEPPTLPPADSWWHEDSQMLALVEEAITSIPDDGVVTGYMRWNPNARAVATPDDMARLAQLDHHQDGKPLKRKQIRALKHARLAEERQHAGVA